MDDHEDDEATESEHEDTQVTTAAAHGMGQAAGVDEAAGQRGAAPMAAQQQQQQVQPQLQHQSEGETTSGTDTDEGTCMKQASVGAHHHATSWCPINVARRQGAPWAASPWQRGAAWVVRGWQVTSTDLQAGRERWPPSHGVITAVCALSDERVAACVSLPALSQAFSRAGPPASSRQGTSTPSATPAGNPIPGALLAAYTPALLTHLA